MSVASSCISKVLLEFGRREKRVLWLHTFYYRIPCNILDWNPNPNISKVFKKVELFYVDICLQFKFRRISELQFRVICNRTFTDHSMIAGDYVIQFHCDTNIFDEDPRTFQMQSYESEAFADFWLNASYFQDFLSNDLLKQFEFKILVKMIEYDCVYPFDIHRQLDELHKRNKVIFNNKLLLEDLCYIFHVTRFEDLFAGRHNELFSIVKNIYISRTVTFSKEIAGYLRSKNASTLSLPNIESILTYLLRGKDGKLHNKELIKVYIEAHHLGLKFLQDLCRDCILYRLSIYETLNLPDYENWLFEVLISAVRVGDENLFEKAAEKISYSENESFNPVDLLEKLEKSSIHSKFVIRSLERRLKKLESCTRIGIGTAATSRFLELL